MLAGALYFAIPLALTVAVEAFVAFLCGFSGSEQRSLLLVNCATNLSLNLALYFINSAGAVPLWAATAALEALVVLAEWLLLRAMNKKKRQWLLLSLLFNASSYSFGLLLSLILF